MMKRFQSEATEMEQKYEEKLTNQYESLMLKHRMEITEVEERKNTQIADLIKKHEEAFNEMKTYYNDITMNNLSLIKSMQVNLVDTWFFFLKFFQEKSCETFETGTNGYDEK